MTEQANAVRDLRGWLIMLTLIAIVCLIGAAIPLMMSVMVFDAGETKEAWTMFWVIWSAPLLLIAGIVIGWGGYLSSSRFVARGGIVLMIAPIVMVAAVAVLFLTGFL